MKEAENKFMQMAIEEARKGIHAGHGGPFESVIVKDGEVVGRGHNRVVKNNDPTCHGEIAAIRNAGSKLDTFDLSGRENLTDYLIEMDRDACLDLFDEYLTLDHTNYY